MTERVKELLDVAAAEVRPRVVDPARRVLERAHQDRRRRQLVGGLASVVTVAALVATVGIVGQNRPSAPSGIQPAAEPEVVDGEVRAGGVTLPIPDGWQVVKGDGDGIHSDLVTNCETKPRSVLVNRHVGPGGTCYEWKPIIEIVHWDPMGTKDETYEHVLLPGGQPAWISLQSETNDDMHRTMRVPWSTVMLSLAAPRTELPAILESITTTAPKPTRLVLPEAPVHGRIVVTAHLRDRARPEPLKNVAQVASRLSGLTELPASDEPTCPRQDDLDAAATIALQGKDVASQTEVSINVWGDCAEVISSRGGRVRAPGDIVTELAPR